MAISGAAVAYCVTGGIVAYSGIKGSTISDTVKAVLAGNLTVTPTEPISATVSAGTTPGGSGSAIGNAAVAGASAGSGQPVANTGSAQAILQQTAAKFGWGSGTQWQALSNVEMAEAGFNPRAKNPSSGALGLAQALGHGNSNTGGTLGNEYGGFGLSDAQAKLANSGDAAMQALWMCNYIQATYPGGPVTAWAHEQADHWY